MTIILICSFIFVLHSNLFAKGFLPAELKPASDRIVAYIMQSDYDSAFFVADSLDGANPHDPIGSLFRLFILGMRQLDLDILLDSLDFVETYKKTSQKISEYKRIHGENSYIGTLEGFANAANASFYLRLEKYLPAVGTGLDAIKSLNNVKKNNPDNADVDFFLGTYDYAKSELRKKLWMVMFWYKGSKEEGIERLINCENNSDLSYISARLALADIYVAESMYCEAGAQLDRLNQDYPNSRFTLWTTAKLHEATNQWAKAADDYALLSESYSESEGGDYNAFVTKSLQIKMLIKNKECAKARKMYKVLSNKKNSSKRYNEVYNKTTKIINKNCN